MGWVADRLAEQDQLRSDVPPERAAHVIWLLASFDAYDLLAARGLEPEDVTPILTETAEGEVKDLSRDRSPSAAQYVHVVISPENGGRISDEDFRKIAREWTHDGSGGEYPHVGAVHRDSGSEGRGEGHDHMHLLIARDKLSKDELKERKERSEELVRDIERFRGIERDTGRESEREREAERGDEARGVRQQEAKEREPERQRRDPRIIIRACNSGPRTGLRTPAHGVSEVSKSA